MTKKYSKNTFLLAHLILFEKSLDNPGTRDSNNHKNQGTNTVTWPKENKTTTTPKNTRLVTAIRKLQTWSKESHMKLVLS